MQNNVDFMAPPPIEGVGGGGTGYGWNDGSHTGTTILASEIDVSRQPTSDLVHVWCMPSTAIIGHQEPPRPLERVSLLAARNERESAQIALRPKMSWTSGDMVGYLQIHCSDFCSPSGDRLNAGKEVTIRRVVPILGVPDALVPIDLPSRIGLLPGETCALWVSFDVPVTQPPGVYIGEIWITAVRGETEFAAEKVESEKLQMKKDLQGFLAQAEAASNESAEVLTEALRSICEGLHQVLQSPLLSAGCEDFGKMEIDEEFQASPSVQVQFSITVWDFVLPITPSLPAVFGVSLIFFSDISRYKDFQAYF